MAGLTGHFTADFSSFKAAVDAADTQLKGFDAGASKVQASLNRMGQALSGTQIQAQAALMAKAVEDVGGVSALTEKELQRVGATAQEAAEKLRAIGKDVPANIQAIADAAAHTGDTFGKWAGQFDIQKAISDPLGTAKAGLGSFLETLGPVGIALSAAGAAAAAVGGALFELGQATTASDARLHQLQEIAGGSGRAFGDLQFALAATGHGVVDLDRIFYMFEQRMETSPDKVDKGLKAIGLSLAVIEAMQPDQRILALSEAMREAGEETNKAAANYEIFGKAGREILPALMQDLTGLAAAHKSLSSATDETIAKAEEFEVAEATSTAKAGAAWEELGRRIGPVTNAIALGYAHMKEGLADFLSIQVAGATNIWTGVTALLALSPSAIDAAVALARLRGELPPVASSTKALADGTGAAAAGLKQYAEGVAGLALRVPDLAQAELLAKGATRDLAEEHSKLVAEQKHGAETAKALADTWREYTSLGSTATATIRDMDGATVEGIKYDLQRGASQELLVKVYWATKEQVKAVAAQMEISAKAQKEFTKNELDLAEAVLQGNYNLTQRKQLLPGAQNIALPTTALDLPAFSELPKKASVVVHEMSSVLEQELTTTLRNVPELFTKAFLGGGGLEGAMKGIGTQLAGDLSAAFADKLKDSIDTKSLGGTALFAGITGGIGVGISAAVTGVKALLEHFFGISQEIQHARTAETQFEEAIRATLSTTQKAAAGGEQWKETVIGVRDAYLQVGKSEAEALATLKAAQNTDDPARSAAAIKSIQAVLAATGQTKAAVDSILSAAQGLAGGLSPSLRALIAQLIQVKGLTQDERTALEGLATAPAPDYASLTSLASTYGLTLGGLGSKFAQGNLEGQAKGLYADFSALTAAGADVGGVLQGMAKKIGDLVKDSVAFGTAIPDNMKPLISNLIDTGQLTDSAGDKFTDLAAISFEDTPVDAGVAGLTEKVTTLIASLTGDAGAVDAVNAVSAAVVNVPTDHTTHFHFEVDALPNLPAGVSAEGASSGGLVTARGIQSFAGGGVVLPFRPKGTDTVPAMLTPGEVVLTKDQQARLAAGGAPVIDLAGVRADMQGIRADLAQQRTTLAKVIARAVRDEVQKVGTRR